MKKTPVEEPPPKSTDLDGWRRAVAEDRLHAFRPEALVAAFQDLGPQAGAPLRNALTKHLSAIIVGMLRKRVGFNRPNQGKDIIFHVHGQIIEALLKPHSADGRGLRVAFGARVIFRMKTALADEAKAQIVSAPKFKAATSKAAPVAAKGTSAEEVELVRLPAELEGRRSRADDHDEAAPTKRDFDPALMDDVEARDNQIDSDRIVNRVLETIPSYKKRLAYYLHLHNVPAKSKDGDSIAKAVGVSERTVRAWIEEIESDLKQNEEVRNLLKTIAGARS